MVMSDFFCEEVQWENCSVKEGEDSWGKRLLDMVKDNVMNAEKNNKYAILRSGEKPSRLT